MFGVIKSSAGMTSKRGKTSMRSISDVTMVLISSRCSDLDFLFAADNCRLSVVATIWYMPGSTPFASKTRFDSSVWMALRPYCLMTPVISASILNFMSAY